MKPNSERPFLYSLLMLGSFVWSASAGILDLTEADVVASSIHGGSDTFAGAHAFDGDPGTRWAAEFPNTEQWVHVDLGQDVALEKITIDWETANATDFQILMRTDAQGPDDDPASWTPVATVTGAAGLPGGGAQGDDHAFNFLTNQVEDLMDLGIETATVDVTNPVGRYLMIATTDYSTTCCGGPSIWELVVEAGDGKVADADEDGMPDFWEEENELDPNDPNDAAGDGDNDNLANLDEFKMGTDPAKADTDEDSLLDGAETNTRTWVSATDTGTSPRNADSDGDTLADGIENPDLPFAGADQPGTDPNIADTDDDGFSDSVELAQGTDPTDAQSPPPPLDLSGATVVESSVHGGVDTFVGRHAFDGEVGTRWAAEFTGESEWVYVDLGEPKALAAVIIDWETANAAEYNLLIWEGGGEPSDDPADWTVVAEVTETAGLPGGGQRGDDHHFDFSSGTFTDVSEAGIGGTANILRTNPVTQYLMIDAFEFSGTCCNGASIWEVTIFPGAGIAFEVTDIARGTDGAVDLTWTSFAGQFFDVEASSGLNPGSWQSVLTDVPAAGGDALLTSAMLQSTPGAAMEYYRVVQVPAPPFLETGFEEGAEGWTVGLVTGGVETGTTWEFGPPANGPATAHTGENAAGTGLSANYEDDTTIQLRTPVIDTQGALGVKLTFWYFLDALEGEGGRVNLLEENGDLIQNFEPIYTGGPDGNTADWTEASLRLPNLDPARPFIIEFQFLTSGDGTNGAGWFIDDVRVGK